MAQDQETIESNLEIDQKRAKELAKKINDTKYLKCKNWSTLRTINPSKESDGYRYQMLQVPSVRFHDAVELDSIRRKYRGNPDFDQDSCKIKYRVVSVNTDGSSEQWYEIGGHKYQEFPTADGNFIGPVGLVHDVGKPLGPDGFETKFIYVTLAVKDDILQVIEPAFYADGRFHLLYPKDYEEGQVYLSTNPVEKDRIIYYRRADYEQPSEEAEVKVTD